MLTSYRESFSEHRPRPNEEAVRVKRHLCVSYQLKFTAPHTKRIKTNLHILQLHIKSKPNYTPHAVGTDQKIYTQNIMVFLFIF